MGRAETCLGLHTGKIQFLVKFLSYNLSLHSFRYSGATASKMAIDSSMTIVEAVK